MWSEGLVEGLEKVAALRGVSDPVSSGFGGLKNITSCLRGRFSLKLDWRTWENHQCLEVSISRSRIRMTGRCFSQDSGRNPQREALNQSRTVCKLWSFCQDIWGETDILTVMWIESEFGWRFSHSWCSGINKEQEKFLDRQKPSKSHVDNRGQRRQLSRSTDPLACKLC